MLKIVSCKRAALKSTRFSENKIRSDTFVTDLVLTQFLGSCHKSIEVLQSAEHGVDVPVVSDVVPEVCHGGGVYGGQPHPPDPDVLQVV